MERAQRAGGGGLSRRSAAIGDWRATSLAPDSYAQKAHDGTLGCFEGQVSGHSF